jgi:hypothetical protein
MYLLKMRFLLFSVVLMSSCASEYKQLKPINADQNCIARNRPSALSTSWYTARIDVVGKHLSGLLFIKNMPDHSNRIVFTNEAGVKFFDFEFDSLHHFQVKQVISQLNKKPVVTVLQQDFALMMGIPFKGELSSWEKDDELYFGRQDGKGTFSYFITPKDCSSVIRFESGSKRKKKVTIQRYGKPLAPDSIRIQHNTFAMSIGLRKLEKN